jgi:glycosyltransferase involved in cell wall biosynthesis
VYHNITPAGYLRGVNRRVEFECRRGREELRSLVGKVELALADSEFNRRELEEMGFGRTAIVPIIVDFSRYRDASRPELVKRFRDGWVNILHVGRFVPNKKVEDVVKCFYFYKKINPRSRLILVGTDVNLENYSGAVKELVGKMGLADVHFPGHVDHRNLCAYYRSADLYLLMSEHEGFCVPLLEAMHFGVPIIAFRAAAVPHTMGNAGVLIEEKRFEEVAELMDLIVSDPGLRATLAAAGRERLKDFAVDKIENDLWEVLSENSILR